MTDTLAAPSAPSQLPKVDPESLELRGRPRPAIRFRKGVIVGLTGAASAALVGLAWTSLRPPAFHLAAQQESADPATRPASEVLAGAPQNYSDVPRLGPPLPGDLGRAILDRQRQLAADGEDGAANGRDVEGERAAATAAAERQQRGSEAQAAQASAVLVRLQSSANAPAVPATAPSQSAAATSEAVSPVAQTMGSQQHKLAFAESQGGDINPNAISAPASPWVLSAGTVIAASLVTGLDSDLPGMVIAQVTENVRDSATGKTILIPQGARLIGQYDSQVSYGQRRALLVWTRILFPDGSSLDLDRMPATDSGGFAGLEGRVNSHGWRLLKGVLLSSVLGLGTDLSFGKSDIARAISQSTQQSGTRAGEQLVGRELDVQPTLTVPPGWPVRVLVDKDLILQPWKD